VPRQKKRELPVVKELRALTGAPSPDQVDGSAPEFEEPSPPDLAVDYEEAASIDDTVSSGTDSANRVGRREWRHRRHPGDSSGLGAEPDFRRSLPENEVVEELEVEEEITLSLPRRVILEFKEQARREKTHYRDVVLRALKQAEIREQEVKRWPSLRPIGPRYAAREIGLFLLLSRLLSQ
jgi:hypothetical protein